jgi:deazaflavin-dependent oxidoreductase (nitroreductase family)
MTAIPQTNADVIAGFRANGGNVPAPYDNPPPMLLLHTTGRTTGKEHITPMRGLVDGETVYVFGTAHGASRDPDWVRNIEANGLATIEIGTETREMRGERLTGTDADAIWQRWVGRVPPVAAIASRLDRPVPVMRLTPR